MSKPNPKTRTEDDLSDLTTHGLLDKCEPGCLPCNVKKEVVHAGNNGGEPSPPYPAGARLRFHFTTTATEDEKLLDDSRNHPKAMEIIIGKKFKVEIWELALNTMRLHEVSRFIAPRAMCALYPMVAKVLRDTYKPSDTPRSKSCCGSMLNGTGHPDLDELLRMPQSLTFTFELLEVGLPGEYEMESWYMTDDQKMESLGSLQEAGNNFFAQQQYKEASEKYFEAIARIEQLLTREVPGSQEMKDLQLKKVPLLLNFAFCKQKEKDYYESIIHNNSVLELDPDNLKALFRRGQCHKLTGSYGLARQDFSSVLKLDETLHNAVRRELEEMILLQRDSKDTEKQRYQRMFSPSP